MFQCANTNNPAARPATIWATCCLAALMLVAPVSSLSVHAADPATGKTLALQWCSSCHLVSDDQPTAASVSLPSFYDIAKDPDWTQASLATFLKDPHPKMPNMNLGNIEIANLASYIDSLSTD